MTYEKQKAIVDLLLANTKKNLVDWQPTFNDGIFRVSFAASSLQIASVDRDDEFDYVVRVFNNAGVEADMFDDVDLDGERRAADRENSYYLKMKELYEGARRKALGTDEVLDEIIGGLKLPS